MSAREETYIREATAAQPTLNTEGVLAFALTIACLRIDELEAQLKSGGFDRSATLARAVKRKAEEDADGHHAL